MLRNILGSQSRERVLAFLVTHPAGYASEIAQDIGMDLYAVQQQLGKFESSGLLMSRTEGRRRIYTFHAGFPLLRELRALVEKSLALQPRPASRAAPRRLPERYRIYFWEYSFASLSWDRDQELVIRRLLTSGSWEAVSWLRKRLGDRALRAWIIAHRGRGLSPRQLRFWALALALPKRQADLWVGAARAAPWNGR